MMNIDNFSLFINRSLELQSIMADVFSNFEPAADSRCIVSFQAGILSFEHHLAIFQLISDELYSPGFSLLRPQFENLVRGIWLLHAATDSWIEKFNQPLTEESAKKGDASPNLTEMIEHLKKNNEAPQHIVEQLQGYKDATWKALNSYTHGGMHPLTRSIDGYPLILMYNSLRNSNAVAALNAQLLAITSGDLHNMQPIRVLHEQFQDCFPIIQPDGSIST